MPSPLIFRQHLPICIHIYIYIFNGHVHHLHWSSTDVFSKCPQILIHHTAKHVAQFSHPPSMLLARLEGYTPPKNIRFIGEFVIIYGWRTPFSDKNPLIDGSEVSIMTNYSHSPPMVKSTPSLLVKPSHF